MAYLLPHQPRPGPLGSSHPKMLELPSIQLVHLGFGRRQRATEFHLISHMSCAHLLTVGSFMIVKVTVYMGATIYNPDETRWISQLLKWPFRESVLSAAHIQRLALTVARLPD